MTARFLDGRFALALSLLALAGAGTNSRSYRNEAMRVRLFEPPIGWEMAPQPSYPRLLASYAHHEGGRLTLSAQRVPVGATAATLADSARVALARQGFTSIKLTPDGARMRLDAELDGGKRFGKQLYVVEAGIAYVITLVAPKASEAILSRDFEDAIRTLQLGAAEVPR